MPLFCHLCISERSVIRTVSEMKRTQFTYTNDPGALDCYRRALPAVGESVLTPSAFVCTLQPAAPWTILDHLVRG